MQTLPARPLMHALLVFVWRCVWDRGLCFRHCHTRNNNGLPTAGLPLGLEFFLKIWSSRQPCIRRVGTSSTAIRSCRICRSRATTTTPLRTWYCSTPVTHWTCCCVDWCVWQLLHLAGYPFLAFGVVALLNVLPVRLFGVSLVAVVVLALYIWRHLVFDTVVGVNSHPSFSPL